jgi:hypothetical protein
VCTCVHMNDYSYVYEYLRLYCVLKKDGHSHKALIAALKIWYLGDGLRFY